MSLAWAAPEVRCHANRNATPYVRPPPISVHRRNAERGLGKNRDEGVDSGMPVLLCDGFTGLL